ncbi:sensor histidine kinase [Hyalangium rubrum]|uniref:histidine kinase n=1 Tax=Hyalangium rubrum TaxID=3103134 RepID=A0ABU5H5Z4_9BACT|nr:HAMP domain-containing sensor histidine kinase [Hyalangium sp. s54d21]MDY7228547.1 HAMP domain-containing sensor histidine kinase [Hyalangium sp. s54d21]
MTQQDTRAFDAILAQAVDGQRRGVLKAGAAVRLVGTLAFLLIVLALWLGGRPDWAPYPLPLGLYLGVAGLLFALHRKPLIRWLSVAQSVVDVGLVFWLQHTALPISPFPAGVAGFSLGLFALVVVLSSLTLFPSVVYLTTTLAAIAQATLMREAGVGFGAVAVAVVVLGMVAVMSQYGSHRVRQLVLALSRTEVERQVEARRFQEVEQARGTIENMLSEARAHNAQLLALQQEKDQLTQFVVHDLRSPLSALTMTFSLLENELAMGDAGLRQAVRTGVAVTGRMERMIAELLDIPRLEEGQLELRAQRITAIPLLEEVRLAAASGAQFRRLKLEAEAPADLEFHGDRSLLLRVVENLTTNALRHTPPGGRVRLEVGTDAGGTWLAVRNDGTPIPPELRERLFGKYSQGDKERSHRTGYGLGLYFCRLAVEAHGGRLSVEDTPGWPTSFVARLPPLPAQSRSASPG